MKRGQLRVYLGAAPGVGKTFAMLSEGHRRTERGTDVVVAFVETHRRPHTAELLGDLEVVPRTTIRYRDTEFAEMDLDAVLARRPEVALVDELAHTNVPGCRNAKRWGDIEELLAAGIDVISTINIQHLESLNDVVSEITGVRQQETIPDAVVRQADQIELVDMSPQALRRRLAHGNVYAAEKIDAALGNYFRVGNLTALRELALLWLADRVDDALQAYRMEQGIAEPWNARERVVVALTGGPEGETLLRRGARIAGRGAGGELIAVHVTRDDGLLDAAPGALEAQRSLAERLGGTFHRIVGDDIAESIVDFATGSNASLLVVGMSRRSRWGALFHDSVGADIVRTASRIENIDVHVVAHEGRGRGTLPRRTDLLSRNRRLTGWLVGVLGPIALVTILATVGAGLGLSTDLLLLVALTVGVALLGGMGPAVVSAVLGSGLANFFLTPPFHTLAIASVDNAVALVVSVVVGVAVASVVDLAARRSLQAREAAADAEVLSILAGSVVRGEDTIADICGQVRDTFGLAAVSLLERDDERSPWRLVHRAGEPVPAPGEVAPTSAGRSGDDDGEETEVTITATLMLVLSGRSLPGSSQRLVEAFAAQAVAVLERERLRARADQARLLEQGDAIRTALLTAVSHDLRTPLASIKAATSSLRQSDVQWSDADRMALLETIGVSTDRLERLISNLLDLSRLQSGTARAHIRRVSLDEVILPALDGLPPGRIQLDLDETLPLVATDPGLLERAVANIVQNAVNYSPADRPVLVSAEPFGTSTIEIRVVDRGRGVSEDDKERMFQPFQRLGDIPAGNGLGLGLAVARGFLDAVNASVLVDDTPGGGLTMVIRVPISSSTREAGSRGQRAVVDSRTAVGSP
jgi:two-component system sensor histidine kinase KdpD